MVSKVPLPMYRADLDERHGSTQKEVKTYASYYKFNIIIDGLVYLNMYIYIKREIPPVLVGKPGVQ